MIFKTGIEMKFMRALLFIVAGLVMSTPLPVQCMEVATKEIMKELNALKDRVNRLENELIRKDKEIERLKEDTAKHAAVVDTAEGEEPDRDLLDTIADRVSIGGLVEVGAVYGATENSDGTDEDSSDVDLTTVEIGVEVEVNDWVNAEMVFLYEDAMGNTTADEGDVSLDVGTITFGNSELIPFYFSAGKMYVPYGAILTHFPDDPLVDQPMTLAFGEMSEKAVLVGYENSGINVSGYVFNGEVDESGSDNTIEDFGFDVNYTGPEDSAVELFTGLSYISNIAEGLGGVLHDATVEDYVGGLAAYLHLGFQDLFFDAEYMAALDEFATGELGGADADEPSVWNIEAGYNWNWGKNLEIALKYAGSDETGALGFSESRYGICLNQEIFDGVVGSVAYFRDDFHSDDTDGRDDRDVLCGQVAIEF